MDSRYVTAPEAAWRLLGFKMHHQTHTIVRLQIHLPDEQSVYFTEDNIRNAIERTESRDTTLTAWFTLNRVDVAAREFLYTDIPQHYVFHQKKTTWERRLRHRENNTIGRMYSVNINSDVERFCLRLLLLHIKGATSFEHIRTVGGVHFPTFKEAAQRLGLFQDDELWDLTLQEASNEMMPQLLRELFANICALASPPNAKELFEKYKHQLIEDFSRHPGHTPDCHICLNSALLDIQEILIVNGKKCQDFGIPTPTDYSTVKTTDIYDAVLQSHIGVQMQAALNDQQRETFEDILSATQNDTLPQRCYFIDGPGGSGKTYLYQTLLHSFRGNKQIALAVASTGIAANLLEGGRTYHSQFKLPVPLLDTSTSSMRQTSNDATVLRKTKIIIWDESTMAPSNALRCVDKLLQELMKNNKPFGGKTIILGGDFRQTLPVVAHGSRSAIVESSIKFNSLWDKFKIIKLQTNVRSVDPEFSSWLINLGDGKLTNEHGFHQDIFQIPPTMICKNSIVKEIYGDHLQPDHISQFEKTAILCPKNCDVDNINEEVLSLLEGESRTYLSTDSIDDESQEDKDNYPIEFLNELTPSGMPVHKLKLKIGSIIMLLRNLNTKRGLCNGTRMIVTAMRQNLLIAKVLTPTSEPKNIFIPRIDLAPSNTKLPFVLRRRQFPVKLAFAMTINKSQGQTFDRVGIYLPDPVFSHGQLYVAFSRVKSSADVKIKLIDGREQGYLLPGTDACFTKNVVFKEIYSK
uniref:ATP-dependent DNA helicase n=1 Tax=Leptobrachium leishanense TaxID=445787 RepID=A0A8C5M2A9_9ANUR